MPLNENSRNKIQSHNSYFLRYEKKADEVFFPLAYAENQFSLKKNFYSGKWHDCPYTVVFFNLF
jgi:hypothetical protein